MVGPSRWNIFRRLQRRYVEAWPNPPESIGARRTVLRDRHQNVQYTVWEVAGAALDIWNVLREQIMVFLEGEMDTTGLTFEMLMIGRDEASASPKVMFYSENREQRKHARATLEKSHIMGHLLSIGLGDSAQSPGLVAQDDIETLSPPELASNGEKGILAYRLDPAFGRRLFISGQDDRTLRPATGGPVLYVNDNVFQLTARHAFIELGIPTSTQGEEIGSSGWDFDGMSDVEDSDFEDEREVVASNDATTIPTARTDVLPQPQSALDQDIASVSLPEEIPPEQDSMVSVRMEADPVAVAVVGARAGGDMPRPSKSLLTDDLVRIGKLALLSDPRGDVECDYALVELEGSHKQAHNQIPSGPKTSGRWLNITRLGENIGATDINVVTVTASSGYVSGRLSANASCMHLPGWKRLQEVYPLILDKRWTISQGDCGAGIVDRADGRFYGHLVAGVVGTGVGYIIPGTRVIGDIKTKFGAEVRFCLPEERRQITTLEVWKGMRGRKDEKWEQAKLLYRDDPWQFMDFGSPKYLSKIEPELNFGSRGIHEWLGNKLRLEDLPTRILETTNELPTLPSTSGPPYDVEDQTTGSGHQALVGHEWTVGKQRALVDGIEAAHITEEAGSNRHPGKNPFFRVGNGQQLAEEDGAAPATHAFELLFFKLPNETKAQVIGCLPVPDILSLRLASRSWNNLITFRESLIASSYLEQSQIPAIVTMLYPPPDLSQMSLHYVAGIRYRFRIAVNLSTIMTEWIAKHLFLLEKAEDRLAFKQHEVRIRRRLIPLLFTVFHFLETYRQKLLVRLSRGPARASTILSIERQIMQGYGKYVLLHVHEFFPLLVAFLDGRFRPPSYINGIERPIRGYTADPPPDSVQVSLLLVGGLAEIVKVSSVKPYKARRAAIDDWFLRVSDGGRQSTTPLQRLMPSFLSVPAAESGMPGASQRHVTHPTIAGESPIAGGSGKGIQIPSMSLASGPPMGRLTPEESSLLLQNLPTSKSDIWVSTAEDILLARGTVSREQDIKGIDKFLRELSSQNLLVIDYFLTLTPAGIGNHRSSSAA